MPFNREKEMTKLKKKLTNSNAITRRSAIKIGAGATAAGMLGLSAATVSGKDPADNVKPASFAVPGYVVCVHKPQMVGKRRFPNAEAAQEMVHKAVCTLTGESDIGRAFGHFVKPDDRVGIKINVLGGRYACTMKEVTDAIVKGVKAAGVPEHNIMIFDQFGGNMRGARYRWQEKPDKMRVINHEVLGYEKEYTKTDGGGKGKFAKTLLWATAVINVPPLKDHDLAGITCAMKNMVFGCVERPAMMHTSYATALGHFYAHEKIRSRVKLIIGDGSFVLFDGGPKNNPKANVAHESVYATTDPVAMDAICAEVVESYRAKKNMRTLKAVRRPVVHLELAEKLGLGIANLSKIKLKTVELPPYDPQKSV
jgi:uncharacterized protein (DUF362 family)